MSKSSCSCSESYYEATVTNSWICFNIARPCSCKLGDVRTAIIEEVNFFGPLSYEVLECVECGATFDPTDTHDWSVGLSV